MTEPVKDLNEFVDDRLQRVIVNALKDLTPDQRLGVFGKYCVYCGDDSPNCQCWNDE